jgi:hypothetical protein
MRVRLEAPNPERRSILSSDKLLWLGAIVILR